QAAVAFEDVAIYFSPEEWVELAPRAVPWGRRLQPEVGVSQLRAPTLRHQRGEGRLVLPTWWLCRAVGTLGHFSDAVPLLPAAPRHGMAGEDPPGDGDQGHWVPPVPPSGGAKELGCPPMGTLGAHQGEHLGPAPSHECTACGKVFQHHRNLLTHKKHRGRHRHACAECGCTFCLRGDLLRHRAVHAGEGSYPCALCSRRFRHKRDLQEHRREHAAAAPRQCPQCQKRFEDEASLSQHRASHVEERPFPPGSWWSCPGVFVSSS
uniref:C2H2-type domain-containing protein n=1 Tax=Anas platyrhynchos platyrhynchos TaxID=8840 RepID=A0A493U1V3_ANAPP